MTRGIKRDVDELVKFLETRTMMLPYIDDAGNKFTVPIQGNLQPIQLWSYVFPENHKDAVLNSLKFGKENRDRWINNSKMKVLVESLRLGMGAKKIPKFSDKKGEIYLPQPSLANVSIIPIGVKYDRICRHPDGKTHEDI